MEKLEIQTLCKAVSFSFANDTLPLFLGYAQFHTSHLVSKTELAKWGLSRKVCAAQKLILLSVN